jgi:hypothetical protein
MAASSAAPSGDPHRLPGRQRHDPGGVEIGPRERQHLPRLVRQRGERQPLPQGRVGGEARGAEGVADDGEALAARRPRAGQRFGGGEQVVERFDQQHAAAAQRRAERRVLLSGRVQQPQAGPQRHHRPQPGGGAGGGEEAPRIADAAYVQQDRAGARIAAQPVQHHREADILVAAGAQHMAESHAVRRRPVQHRAADGTGLRHQRHPPRARRQRGDGRVQPDGGHGEPHRVGAQ